MFSDVSKEDEDAAADLAAMWSRDLNLFFKA